MTVRELLDYIIMMSSTPINMKQAARIYSENSKQVHEFISVIYTATQFHDNSRSTKKKSSSNEVMTTEMLYYYMSAFQIDFSADRWHISRLITLLKIAAIKNSDEPMMSEQDNLLSMAEMNEQRKLKYNTKG